MRISQCTRCDQLIEYDEPYEGDEVLCPACDNITRLKEIPASELPDTAAEDFNDATEGDSRKSRAPLRIQSADALPKPDQDPVAPVKPSDADGIRGDTSAAQPFDADLDVKPTESAKPPAQPEFKILAGTEAEKILLRIEDDASPRPTDLLTDNGLRLRLPFGRNTMIGIAVLLLLLGLLAYALRPTDEDRQKDAQEELNRRMAAIEHVPAIVATPIPRSQINTPTTDRPTGSGFAFGSGRDTSPPATERGMVSVTEAGKSSTPSVIEMSFSEPPTSITPNTTRFQDEAYSFFVGLAMELPYRLFDNTVVDLRGYAFAMRKGMTEFNGGWRLLGGTVAERTDDGLYLRIDPRYFGNRRVVYIKDFPKVNGLSQDANFAVIGRLNGVHKYRPNGGAEATIENFEFGHLPSDRMIDLVKDEASKREAQVRQAMVTKARDEEKKAAEKEAQKKAERDARVIAFLEKRVKDGSASAQFSLGVRYLEGDGVPKNRREGIRLLKASAKQGYPRAKNKITADRL